MNSHQRRKIEREISELTLSMVPADFAAEIKDMAKAMRSSECEVERLDDALHNLEAKYSALQDQYAKLVLVNTTLQEKVRTTEKDFVFSD
jgi:chromosome segregation ATPase